MKTAGLFLTCFKFTSVFNSTSNIANIVSVPSVNSERKNKTDMIVEDCKFMIASQKTMNGITDPSGTFLD